MSDRDHDHDQDHRQQREEQATRELLDAYAKLVAMAAEAIADTGKAEHLTETIDGMQEGAVRAMLIARIAAEAVHCAEIAERVQQAPFDGLGDEPTFH
ncbi:MAG: hypothetical protein EDQ89_00180 [Acidobacteria bacterium]|nr:MAG: hypothetical protein EDQ89_00180 [Acidobacteriota bacterium]